MHAGQQQLLRCRSSLVVNSRDIHQLIAECNFTLATDPYCLHTRAVRGHACMKAKLWDVAARDFTEILRCRPEDLHARFNRGMALFKSGHIDAAQQDFTQVLKLQPSHVMARYARAGCYNFEGEYHQAIEEYTIALQHDEQGHHETALRLDKYRAEKLMKCYQHQDPHNNSSIELVKSAHPMTQSKQLHSYDDSKHTTIVEPMVSSSEAAPVSTKKPRKGVQVVRVNLSDFCTSTPCAATTPSCSQHLAAPVLDKQPPPAPLVACTEQGKDNETARLQNCNVPIPPRRPPRNVRKVTVAL